MEFKENYIVNFENELTEFEELLNDVISTIHIIRKSNENLGTNIKLSNVMIHMNHGQCILKYECEDKNKGVFNKTSNSLEQV